MEGLQIDFATAIENHIPAGYMEVLAEAGSLASALGMGFYLVGGAVRDLALGRASIDLDLVVEGSAPELARLLAEKHQGRPVVHKRFQTAKVRLDGVVIDLATARKEVYPHPGSLPVVEPSNMREDLYRRDFSMNAMAVDLAPERYGSLLDPFHGMEDLRAGLVRILHDRSFIDDATRIMRAIRYEQRFGFRIEPHTARLLGENVTVLNTISKDRLRHELELFLHEEEPEKVLQRARELNILPALHPALKGDGWLATKFKEARRRARPTPPGLYLALIMFQAAAAEVHDFIREYRLPRLLSRVLLDAVTLRERLQELCQPGLSGSTIFDILHDYSPTAIQACIIGTDSSEARSRLELYLERLRHVRPLLSGGDLQEIGVREGPQVGEVLRMLQAARLDGAALSREDEVRLVRLYLERKE